MYIAQGSNLPPDLAEKLRELSEQLGEPPNEIIVAAVDHFTRIDPERQKAIMMGTSRRRRISLTSKGHHGRTAGGAGQGKARRGQRKVWPVSLTAN